MKKAFKQGYKESSLQTSLFSEAEVKTPEKCFSCRHTIDSETTKYVLTVKGQAHSYCQVCAKRILRPQEEVTEL